MFLFRPGKDRVTVDEAVRRTQGADAPAVLLNAREQGEWAAGHAPGAGHAPLSRLQGGAPLPDAAQDRPAVVICRSGHRSRRAAELPTGRGVDAVGVKGGMQAWAAAGHSVVDARGNNGSIA
ncbi:rhodanese-like domain-containing protein [Streptomyces tropicalis]|uniref:Rhodanese-like domain-containing protein n=1 Tax=Streptomyces tropicalis TaxID=3034234 RepID=A0ABT6A2Y5_9ACTN|nr:rhodanese-like domain-containing protein [Streptomyces tropicalis]MDF3298822.1 rhodanese-like domain-containing protein [Streptomyces tropicalis]